jgi:DNA mismatch repair protein MutS2
MHIELVSVDKTLRDLEFSRVQALVRRHASCSLGEEAVDALTPVADRESIEAGMAEVREAIGFLTTHGRFSLGGVRDLAPVLERAKRSVSLDGEEFALVLRTMEGTLQTKAALVDQDETPRLTGLAGRLTAGGQSLHRNLLQAIDERGSLRDDASPLLRQLTNKRRTLEGRLEAKLQSFIDRYPECISEPVITRRRGRLVVPIRSGAVGAMEFVVHDRSSTGQTLYAEPPGFVAENNLVSQLDGEIRDEIQRILRALTQELLMAETAFLRDRAVLAHLDGVFARAAYAIQYDASFPEIGQSILLRNARHPLLDAHTVVPVTLSLGQSQRMLVLTGPNTGGKTVTLKTIGLLILMTQAAIPIPASPDSRLPILARVRSDIGDEQSIAQNLSTFSAHMTNIVSVLAEADANSLVLLDELGAGTDPQEGAALGLSVMEALLESDALTVISTHLTPLKYFAIRHPQVKTASMEFDVKTLSPTYRVIEGMPGRSNAFVIAEQLGLPRDRIDRARSFLSQGEIRAEDILDELERERQAMHMQREIAEKNRHEATQLRERYEQQLSAFEEEKSSALSNRFKALDRFLREAQQRLEATLASSQDITDAATQRAHLQEISTLRGQARTKREEASALRHSDSLTPNKLEIGMTVHVRSLAADGRILHVSDRGRVTLDIEGVRVQAMADDLMPARGSTSRASATKPPHGHSTRTLRQPRQVPLELDIRGMTVSDALRSVDEYLDQLLLADIRQASILHGKGTGALRDAVRTYLGTCRFVSSHGYAPPNQGGDGVTVIELSESA